MNEAKATSSEAYNKVGFRTPSLARFKLMRKQIRSQSILRCLEYERLAQLKLTGLVLDFGGGSQTNYVNHMANWSGSDPITFESANIDPVTQPTYLISQDGEIPCENDRYDTVLSLNTFEHIYDINGALGRIRRVLRPGGKLVLIVPFIFRVHGHPDDYWRGTPSFWRSVLSNHGYGNIQIEALNWGPFSTGLTVAGTVGPFRRLRTQLAMLMDLVYFSRKYGQDVMITADQDASVCNAPIAYFVSCTKAV